MEPTEAAGPEAKEKRRYIRIKKGEFIKIAQKHGNINGIVEETGMTYSGVYMRLKALKTAKVSLKASLFQRQKPVRKAKIQEEVKEVS